MFLTFFRRDPPTHLFKTKGERPHAYDKTSWLSHQKCLRFTKRGESSFVLSGSFGTHNFGSRTDIWARFSVGGYPDASDNLVSDPHGSVIRASWLGSSYSRIITKLKFPTAGSWIWYYLVLPTVRTLILFKLHLTLWSRNLI